MDITPMLLRSWDACWTDTRIATYFAGRESLTPREIAEDLAHISHNDRMWVLTMTLAHKDLISLVEFARSCADAARSCADAAVRAGDAFAGYADRAACSANARYVVVASYAAANAAATARLRAKAAIDACGCGMGYTDAADVCSIDGGYDALNKQIADLLARIEA